MGKILLICGYIFVLATLVHGFHRGDKPEGEIYEGCYKCEGDTLIFSQTFKETAESSKNEDKVEVHVDGQKITGISVQDIQGDGESHITDGGVDEDHVTIELKSGQGNGYHFQVEINAKLLKIRFDGHKIEGVSLQDIEADVEPHITDGCMDEDYDTIEESKEENDYVYECEEYDEYDD